MSNNTGSMWKKWDLHIHTPYSKVKDYLNADWDLFFLNLAKITKQKNISVIGINDYWILDGYYKVRDAWEQKTEFTDPNDPTSNSTYNLSHIEQIFPMVEYRINTYVASNKKLNIHYLFDPKLSIDELKNIISKMYITCNINRQNEKKNGTYENIKDIEHPQMCIFSEDITKFETDHSVISVNYLKAIGYAELDSIPWDEAPTILRESQEIYHFGLLASPKESLNYENKTKIRCILHSSDAHQYPSNIDDTKSKELGHCFTWIKGEPSFEGLKYALEDPDSRIKIQEPDPFLERTPPYIESITFPQSITLTDSNKHSRSITVPQTLYFNRYMNSIIGGRGSGKTTLLEVIKSISDSH